MEPSMLPCGTPAVTVHGGERHPSMTTYCSSCVHSDCCVGSLVHGHISQRHSVSLEGDHGLWSQMLSCNQ